MIRAFRPINLVAIVLVCFAFEHVGFKILQDEFVIRNSFVSYTVIAVLIAASGYLINGYYDREIDKVNVENYQFPFNLKQVTWIYTILTFIALGLAIVFFDWVTLIGFIIFPSILLWMYSYWFKGLPIIGNGVVAFMAMWLPIGVMYIHGTTDDLNSDLYSNYTLLMLSEVFLITFAREIIKDIQDVKGDKQMHSRTLAVRFGLNKAAIVASFFLFWSTLLWFGSLTKYWSDLSVISLVFSLITFVLILTSFILLWVQDSWTAKAKKSSLMLKVSMFSALITLIFI